MAGDSSWTGSGVRTGTQAWPGVHVFERGFLLSASGQGERQLCSECVCVSSSLPSFRFCPRASTPKVSFGATPASAAPGITGSFSFGSPVAASTPSSQAAAPSGFAFGSAGTSSASSAPSGTSGGFTFSSGTTSQAGTAGFSIGSTAPQATSAGLTFGTAPAAAATTSTATLGAATPSAAPFSLGGQPAGGGQPGDTWGCEPWPWGHLRVEGRLCCSLCLLLGHSGARGWSQRCF